MTDLIFKIEDGFVIDQFNNKATIEYWGSEEKAKESLRSLKRCRDCRDCSYCSYCRDCSYCSYCRDCRGKKGEQEDSEFQGLMKNTKLESIHQKVLEAASAPNALRMESWHTCNTTHCRAGWVTTLAGEQGKRLEQLTSCEFAAKVIYRKSSDIHVSANRFYDTNEKAMEDMKRCAELEAQKG